MKSAQSEPSRRSLWWLRSLEARRGPDVRLAVHLGQVAEVAVVAADRDAHHRVGEAARGLAAARLGPGRATPRARPAWRRAGSASCRRRRRDRASASGARPRRSHPGRPSPRSSSRGTRSAGSGTPARRRSSSSRRRARSGSTRAWSPGARARGWARTGLPWRRERRRVAVHGAAGLDDRVERHHLVGARVGGPIGRGRVIDRRCDPDHGDRDRRARISDVGAGLGPRGGRRGRPGHRRGNRAHRGRREWAGGAVRRGAGDEQHEE